jgi:hypothetical protein
MAELNPAPGNLPAKARAMLEDVFSSRRKGGLSQARASEIAWGVVKKSYRKKADRWLRRKTNPGWRRDSERLYTRVEGEWLAWVEKHGKGWATWVFREGAKKIYGAGTWPKLTTAKKAGDRFLAEAKRTKRAPSKAWGRALADELKPDGKRRPSSRNPAPVLPSKTLKRSPIGQWDDINTAELGSALEVEVDGYQLSWRRGEGVLVWSPEKKTLLILEGGRRARARQLEDGSKAARAFERWAGRGAKRESAIDIDPRGSWRSFGSVQRIDYYSDKWGRRAGYTHRTGRGVRLYRLGAAGKPPWLWALKGGRLNVTTRGIVG